MSTDQMLDTTALAPARSAARDSNLLMRVTARTSPDDESDLVTKLSFMWSIEDPEQQREVLTRLIAWAAGAVTQIKHGYELTEHGTVTI